MNLLSLIYSISYLYYNLLLFFYSKGKKQKKHKKYKGGISILIPSFDEVYTIESCIKSIINCERYFNIEIIIIDDGYKSDTYEYLKNIYKFKLIKNRFEHNKKLKSIYYCKNDVDIYLIDKENEGKSIALNTALRLAHYDYFISIDADSIIDKKSLVSMYELIDESILAIGGKIVPISNDRNIIEKILSLHQGYEYLRNFNYSRIAFNKLNCVPLLSGAFSLYRKDVVLYMKGYSSNTKAEDFDLSLKLHEFKKRYGGQILYNHNAIAYTQIPFDIKSLLRQRLRWHSGMLEVFKIHKDLFLKFNRLSLLLWFMKLYEEISVLCEIVCILFSFKRYLYILLISTIITLLFTLYLHKENKELKISLFVIVVFGVLFNKMMIIIKLYSYFVLNDKTWNRVARKNI